MNTLELKTLLEQALPECIALVESADDVHFNAMVSSSDFVDKSRIAQQRLVYQVLQQQLDSGELHALSLKTFTPEQWTMQHG